MTEKRMLTTGDIAHYCGVNFRTVIRWIERGELKAYQLPGRGDNRIQVKDFIAFLQKHHIPIPEAFQETNHRVLIVDDDLLMAKAIQRVLKKQGFETLIAQDGFQAGGYLGQFSPGILTLDLQMPGMSGLDVLKFIRENDQFKHIKILVISALGSEKLQETLAAGADDILEKPFVETVLLEKISRLVGASLEAMP